MINALLAVGFMFLYMLSILLLMYKVICPILDYFGLNDTFFYILITISGLFLYTTLTIDWAFVTFKDILRYTWS